MSGWRVLRAGPLSLLQDAGRLGWQHLGVSPAGPADGHAAAWANHLLGNRAGTPLLEIALGDVLLEAHCATWVALCGADAPLSLDGQPRALWSRFAVAAGQRLQIGFARRGQRLYLAVAGGFELDAVLGSVATQRRDGLGGLDGRGSALAVGDWLACAPSSLPGPAATPARFIPDYAQSPVLRMMVGGDAQAFGREQLAGFFQQTWRVTAQSDRMGARLAGEPLRAPARPWSEGVAFGALQVPPDGQPIVLLADRQTMGGYPLLGWVHPRDCWRLAQSTAHQTLRFTPISVESAQADLRAFYRFFG